MSDVILKMKAIQGDITTLQIDAIVNAANTSLLGGGGVDGAIHRAAGPKLLDACRSLGGCQTGQSKITAGFDLPAKNVIHTVGPIWQDGKQGEAKLLASCYETALQLVCKHKLTAVAFPTISCGVYGYPWAEAVNIAIHTTKDFLASEQPIEQVLFVCFETELYNMYQQALGG